MAALTGNFKVMKMNRISGERQRWAIYDQRKGVSATVWERRRFDRNCFLTAFEARRYCEIVQDGAITAWTRHIERGNVYYTAQSYTGPIKNGVA